jgi:hypothetical protein
LNPAREAAVVLFIGGMTRTGGGRLRAFLNA